MLYCDFSVSFYSNCRGGPKAKVQFAMATAANLKLTPAQCNMVHKNEIW